MPNYFRIDPAVLDMKIFFKIIPCVYKGKELEFPFTFHSNNFLTNFFGDLSVMSPGI